jgi:transcription elongation GreA/GreB family factor
MSMVDGQVVVIESGATVTIEVDGERQKWEITAPHDSNPLRRKLSEMSPLGFALLGHRVGETVLVRSPSPYQVTILAVG